MRKKPSVIVTGASSQVGHFLLPMLKQHGYEPVAVSRRQREKGEYTWLTMDLLKPGITMPPGDALVHIAPVTILPTLLNACRDTLIKRVIAFSSTSIFVKRDSTDPMERQLMASMISAEEKIAAICKSRKIPWTVFRPTLIYGRGQDRNVAVIARFIKRFGFFPVTFEGKGMRQPVHAEDLAAACVDVLDNTATFNRAYELPGGETISYRRMVEKIFIAMGKKPRVINIPAPLYKTVIITCMTLIPGLRFIKTSMVERMKQDLVFDASAAAQDFNWSPRGFQP